MTLKPCPRCGGAAEIRTETKFNRLQTVRAVCPGCGMRGRPAIDSKKAAEAAPLTYWAGMNWNCGLYEEKEGKA